MYQFNLYRKTLPGFHERATYGLVHVAALPVRSPKASIDLVHDKQTSRDETFFRANNVFYSIEQCCIWALIFVP